MDINELQYFIQQLENENQDMERENYMEDIHDKSIQYVKIKRSKQDIIISNEYMKFLKNQIVFTTYITRKKKLQKLNNDLSNLLTLQEDVCRNCKRENPSGEHE